MLHELSNLNVCRLLPLFLQEKNKARQRITQCLAVEVTSEAEKSFTAMLHEQMSLDYDIPKIGTLNLYLLIHIKNCSRSRFLQEKLIV